MRLPILIILFLSLYSYRLTAQPFSPRSLDAILQNYAFKAFNQPRTGVPYAAQLPNNLTGIKASAMRLRSGSLFNRGVHSYNEFQIPTGVIEQPFEERIVLVYQNLGNWSSLFYPLSGYSYLSPVIGLLAYDASNLSATNLPELNITPSEKLIKIKFSGVKSGINGVGLKCVYFDLDGSVEFDNVLPGNVCSTIKQGHFSIVMKYSAAVSPTPRPSPSPAPFPENWPEPKGKPEAGKIVGGVIGALVLLFVIGLMIFGVRKRKELTKKKEKQEMEKAMEIGDNEVIQMASLGNIKAPVAMVTRTRPMLETDYFP
ncbi:hypothetical protein UlMin_012914 [Ulmus minor]